MCGRIVVQKKGRTMMFNIGDRVQIGSDLAWATVTDILPAIGDRVAMYRVQFDSDASQRWLDEGMIYGPFVDQPYGWD
jgi:hypothetical protein